MSAEFEETYRRHFEAVFRYALRCAGRRDVAEDVTSEAFLALLRHWNEIDRSQLPGWLPTAPVASNDTEDGRARNRRVELVKQ